MEVRIALDALDPPAGTIRVSGDDTVLRFTGWLGLLRVLYQVMGSPAGPQAPDVAAATITRALTARRPRAVYLSGKDSRRLAILSRLPAPVLDMARRRVFRLPAPGSLAS